MPNCHSVEVRNDWTSASNAYARASPTVPKQTKVSENGRIPCLRRYGQHRLQARRGLQRFAARPVFQLPQLEKQVGVYDERWRGSAIQSGLAGPTWPSAVRISKESASLVRTQLSEMRPLRGRDHSGVAAARATIGRQLPLRALPV
jgi:hypothetical protein